MDLHKVIVTLHEGTNKQGFIKDLVEPSSLPFIPSREVKLHDERFLQTLCEFFLTHEEILQLGKDGRVKGVDIKSEREVSVDAIREGTFTMVDYGSTGVHTDPSDPAYEYDPEVVKNYRQWGLLASAKKTDQPNVVGNPTPSDYIFKERTGFSADGEGVDIVIFDNGIQWAHPEFSGAPYGGSRVKLIDWWSASPSVTEMQSANQEFQDPSRVIITAFIINMGLPWLRWWQVIRRAGPRKRIFTLWCWQIYFLEEAPWDSPELPRLLS